ncbi:MAG: hypothetical protein WA004_13545 [Saprospiraceae bacterium]
MKKALVFTETIGVSNWVKKTVVVEETTLGPEGEANTYKAFVIITDINGMLQDAYEVAFEREIPESKFIDDHTIPIPVPGDREVHLDTEDPSLSVSVPR